MTSSQHHGHDTFADRLLSMRSWSSGRRRRAAAKREGFSAAESLESRVLLSASPTPEARVNTTTAGTQRAHTAGGRSIDTAADGSYVVVWSSTVGDGSGWGVFGQRYDSAGTPVGGEFAVNSTTVDDQNNAAVAVRDDGSFIVTWQSRLQDGSDFGIYARTFAADGTPTSGEIAVNVTTLGNQNLPAITDLAGGGFAIAWSGRGAGDANGTFARVFDASGTATTGEIEVNTTKAYAQVYASIEADASGGFAVVWHGNGGSDRKNVMFRHFGDDGTPLSSEVVVNETLAGIQKTPSIALTTDGNFIVAWSGNGVGDNDGIFARRIDGSGTPLGGEILINSEVADKQTTPSVTGTGDNGFAVTWADQSSPGTDANFEVAFRQFSGADAPMGDDVIVNSTLPGRQWNPVIARSGDNLIVAWSGRGTGDMFGVYTSWLTPDAPALLAGAGNLLDVEQLLKK